MAEQKRMDALRRKAEALAGEKKAKVQDKPEADALIHELEVHQIELQLQNEELRQAQQELQASRNLYADLFEFAPVGYFTLNRDFLIDNANLTGSRILDIERRRLLGNRFLSFVVPSDQEVLYRCLISKNEGGGQSCEVKMHRRDGSQFYAELKVSRESTETGVVRVAVMDVTERRRAEEALRENESRYRAYFNLPTAGIAMTAPDKSWIEVNPALCTMLGYTREELTRRTWAELTYPEDVESDLAQFRRVLAGEIDGYNLEKRFVRKDRTVIWVDLSVHCVRSGTGDVSYFVALLKDITDRKRAEEQLAAAKESAESARAAAEQANQTKDHFLAVLSHELRTPLTPVVLGISMLQDKPELSNQMRETLEMVRSNIEMEARLIDDLLDVTRIARGKIELNKSPVELCMILQRAVDVCKPDIEARRLHFGLDFGPNQPYWMDADAARLQQVFWNILKNAIKFTPHEGCVGIRCLPNNDHVVVEVTDSGIGIEPKALPKLFNAFEQAERAITQQFGGLGLGLAISKALVELHGGEIEAQSMGRNKGATFRIQLPLSVPAGQPVPAIVLPGRSNTRPLRILLVEDHGVTAQMIRTVLRERGHIVEIAGDTATALELADSQTFDLLLSDLGLPDGSGHDLLRKLRDRGHAFPAIALSGYGQEEDIRRSYQAGFGAHLTKPASREAIEETVALVTGA